ICSKIMSTARANFVVLAIIAFLLIGTEVGDAARGKNPGRDFTIGVMDGHNPTAYIPINTQSDSGDMSRKERTLAGHSSDRKLMASTDGGARHETLGWYCQYMGKK
uniref:Uncharacterized protein n=1 Tax=Oryza brachyantha TaxID=4533 RepID=J3LVU2_ORYBR